MILHPLQQGLASFIAGVGEFGGENTLSKSGESGNSSESSYSLSNQGVLKMDSAIAFGGAKTLQTSNQNVPIHRNSSISASMQGWY